MDCSMSLDDIIKRCQAMKLNCIAIADHDAVEGGLKMQKMAPFKVIVAEEILTPHGEIMGMFLKERIPSGVSVEEALARIREQDGLINLPHPYDPFRGLKQDDYARDTLAEQIDLLEVFNARAPLPIGENKARALANKYNLPVTAGSDSHTLGEIGYTYVKMPDFEGRHDFLEALRKGEIVQRRSSPIVHFGSLRARMKKLFRR
jgi:predicted metal-dependent phosphoesterase TrpH